MNLNNVTISNMNLDDLFDSKDKIRVYPKLAKEIGLHNSIVYSEIIKATDENNIDLTNKQDLVFIQKKYLPFFSVSTIQRSIVFLKNNGYIEVETLT